MDKVLLISDAAKEVKVESHVLRYWEDELKLPIKRNELGHRYYTYEDVNRFKQIKIMKEQGLQLKAIKMILKDGKLDVVSLEGKTSDELSGNSKTENRMEMPITVISEDDISEQKKPDSPAAEPASMVAESSADKAKRLQWLLRQLIRETLQENNKELSREIREGIIKEIDYQFRTKEEREEERERRQSERNEEYYQKMDEILRMKSASKLSLRKKEKNVFDPAEKSKKEISSTEQENAAKEEGHKMIDMNDHKKKKHKKFFF